jgi:hypothetical protein
MTMKLKRPNIEVLLCLLAALMFIVASSKHVYLPLLDLFPKPPHWKRVSNLLSDVLVGYGVFFLGLALLSYILSLRGTSLVATIVNRSRQPLAELRQTLSSSIRGCLASRKDVAWPMAVFGVGLVVRGYFLAQPMRHAESYTFLDFVNQGFLFLFYYPSANNHVLHTILVKLSTLIWGSHPASIRLPAFLAGIACIPLTFCLCRKLMPERSGILASMAMAVAPYMVFYSVNARGNSLLVLLALALALLGIHVAERPSLPGWALVSLVAALGMLTMPTMLFAIAGVYLWLVCLLLCQRRTFTAILRDFVVPCGIMTFAFTLILYLPSIVASGGMEPIMAIRSVEKRSLPWQEVFHQIYPHCKTVVGYFLGGIPRAVLLAGLILLIAGIFGAAVRRNWPLFLLFPSMLLGAGVVFLLKHAIPPARIWLYWMPFSFVVMDAGLTYLDERLPRGLRSLLPPLLVALGSFYAVSLMSMDVVRKGISPQAPVAAKYVRPLLAGSFPEAPFLAKYLKPLLSSNDVVHAGGPAERPLHFYLWYYAIPHAKKAAGPQGKEFFVVKKGKYTISMLTEKPVIKVLDFGNAELYRLLRPEEVSPEKEKERPRRGAVPR